MTKIKAETSTNMAPKQKFYKSIKPITGPVAIIMACFALGIADMIFLREAMYSLLGLPVSMASVMALILATVANFTALLWGKENGTNNEKHSINSHSAASFALWLAIGICYMAIRLMNMLQGIESEGAGTWFLTYVGEIVQMVILAILYIGTGITISSEARTIWDANEAEYRHRKNKFLKQHRILSDDAADLQENIGKLKGYDRNYEALKLQYNKIKQSIRKAEAASMADIVGKTLKNHTEITPSEAHEVMNTILRRRDEEKTTNMDR